MAVYFGGLMQPFRTVLPILPTNQTSSVEGLRSNWGHLSHSNCVNVASCVVCRESNESNTWRRLHSVDLFVFQLILFHTIIGPKGSSLLLTSPGVSQRIGADHAAAAEKWWGIWWAQATKASRCLFWVGLIVFGAVWKPIARGPLAVVLVWVHCPPASSFLSRSRCPSGIGTWKMSVLWLLKVLANWHGVSCACAVILDCFHPANMERCKDKVRWPKPMMTNACNLLKPASSLSWALHRDDNNKNEEQRSLRHSVNSAHSFKQTCIKSSYFRREQVTNEVIVFRISRMGRMPTILRPSAKDGHWSPGAMKMPWQLIND